MSPHHTSLSTINVMGAVGRNSEAQSGKNGKYPLPLFPPSPTHIKFVSSDRPSPMERFSIREYAGKMRGTDFDNCWPFHGDGGGKLPPMPVRRFRLWSDEPEVPRPSEENEVLCVSPLAVEDGRVWKSPGRGKQKTPKKRSIVELFAVAPPVEATTDSEVESGEGEMEGSRPLMKERFKKKEKKKKRKLKVDTVAGKKGKIRRPALPSSVSLSHILKDLVHKKWLKKSSRNHVDGQKKKLIAAKGLKKIGAAKHKETSKLLSRNRKELERSIPLHGILKHQTSRTCKKANTSLEADGGNLMNLCCESEKHVSFSIKDVILGRHKSYSPVELSQLQSLCKIVSDVLAESSANNNLDKVDELPTFVKETQVFTANDKDVASSDIEQTDGSLNEQRQLSCSHGHPHQQVSRNCTNTADTQKTFLAENVDLNVVQSDSDVILVNPVTPSLKYSNGPLATSFVCDPDSEKDNFRRCYDASVLVGPSRKCVSGSDTMSLLTMTSTSRSKHPSSYLVSSTESNGKQRQSSMGPEMDFLGQVPEFQQRDHLSPKDLISSICSSVGSKKSGESSLASDPGSTSKDKFNFEGFVGLPLNSRGELIKLNSGVKFDFNELYNKQNTELGRGHNFNELYKNSVDNVKMKGKFCRMPVYQTDQSNWFPDHYPASNPVGFSELQGFERTKFQNKDQFAHPAERPMAASCHGCRESIQIHNCNNGGKFHTGGMLNNQFQPVIQPTMRLMGQNVAVGKSNFECRGFDDARPWTANDVMAEKCFPSAASAKPLPEQWTKHELIATLPSRNPKENQFQPLEAQPTMYQKPPLLPRTGFGCQPQRMARDGISWVNGNHSSNAELFRYQLPNHVLLNDRSKSVFNTVPETEPVKMRHHLSVMTSDPQSACHHMLLNSTHCKHTQSVSYSSSSIPNPPIQYREHVDFSGTCLNPSSSSLTQWLLNANPQKRTEQSFGPPYSRPHEMNHHHGLIGTDLIRIPSPYTTSMAPFPVCNGNTPQICSSFVTTDSVHPSFTPAITTHRFSSAVNTTCRDRNKNMNGTRSELTHFTGPDNADQSKKRPAGKDDEFMKPSKRPFLRMPDSSNDVACHRRREQLHGYTWHNIVTPEYHTNSNTKVDVGTPAATKEKDSLGTASGFGSSQFDGGSRPGPIKLSAGAKHILKPGLNMHQDCSRPIHSTLRFPAGTSSDKLPARKKAAKVYRF